MPEPQTKSRFSPDTKIKNEEKNGALADLLSGPWNDLDIVRVERVTIDGRTGWRVSYRG